ncbi:MAG: L-threonylcarbamoyladenylate synthase [Nevskiales bacterium]
MAEYLEIHPQNPQPRLLRIAAERLRAGAVIAYPTDSSYALGCHIGDKAAMERIARIRGFQRRHHFTLVCRDLSEIATYARVDNPSYRLLRKLTPGPYTFVLPATREVPRRLQDEKRRTIGLRVPDHLVAQALLAELNEPIMSVTLQLPGEAYPVSDVNEVLETLSPLVDVVVDSGNCGLEPTTVLDLSGEGLRLLRPGKGSVSELGL